MSRPSKPRPPPPPPPPALRPPSAALDTPARPGDGLTRARALEHTGDHARAAALRLEYAHTLCGTAQRIALLREGAARHSGATEEGRSLHQALAETLLRHAEFMEDGAPRRAILMEAARALEEADQGAIAGEIYERLHMLRRAAVAYERAGAVTQLEYVLGLIDRIEHAEAELQRASDEIDAALREGRRFFAHGLLQEHLHDARTARGPLAHSGTPLLRAALARVHADLAVALPRGQRLDLRWGSGQATRVVLRTDLRLGRSPDVELSLGGVSLSREHAALRLEAIAAAAASEAGLDEVELAVALVDLGSRSGTFWRGEALAPGEPLALEGPGELALGLAAARLEVHPLPRERAELGALLRPLAPGLVAPWTLYLPGGGPLWLAPDRPIPAVLELRPPFIAVRIAPGVRAQLGQEPLGTGATVELLHGDRLHLDLPDGRLTLEIAMT
ncbi:FHA domain-containing protein [Nannocystis bainbridge]|uniref:FHA domain-containing protein n=1 Tax=Nannocystis bainbridge TaxID=2995303 RepID=A0ABT5E0P8_9BACT|nr:FHA domain-containing protein [Nannocystis bainbridge]MDC0718985.1 FHA domain-containing protein [Nannocystis bainbridge]